MIRFLTHLNFLSKIALAACSRSVSRKLGTSSNDSSRAPNQWAKVAQLIGHRRLDYMPSYRKAVAFSLEKASTESAISPCDPQRLYYHGMSYISFDNCNANEAFACGRNRRAGDLHAAEEYDPFVCTRKKEHHSSTSNFHGNISSLIIKRINAFSTFLSHKRTCGALLIEANQKWITKWPRCRRVSSIFQKRKGHRKRGS